MLTRSEFRRLEELYFELTDASGEARGARLDALRKELSPEAYEQLERMLADATEGREMLERLDSVAQDAAQIVSPSSVAHSQTPPERIGRYRVVRLLGQGGMGSVYLAEQEEPVRRTVALKVIRGRGSGTVLERFRLEQQALAVMEHPNIARVLDADITEDGLPYFVMEYVPGVAVTTFCEERDLSIEDRIELFVALCDALQHAHQKGVIHRDLKPSNILVSEIEGVAVPKIIDFGVAKATDDDFGDTLGTRVGELVGTPQYMSPEQAALGAVDIDIRSDVYGLGLVLFETLVGDLPVSVTELEEAGFDEMRRIIREDDPPRASRRAEQLRESTSATVATVEGAPGADLRTTRSIRTDPTWIRRLRGDLDWILLKALAKDRDERYASAGALAEDLRRYLGNEPVSAGPPSTAYRARKFVRRHRLGVGAAAAVILAVVVGTIATTVGLVRATRAEARAVEQQRVSDETAQFLAGLFESADPRRNAGEIPSVREIVDRGSERIEAELDGSPNVEARLRKVFGEVYWAMALYDEAQVHLEAATQHLAVDPSRDPVELTMTLDRLASVHRDRGDLQLAEETIRRAIAIGEEHLPVNHQAAGRLQNSLGQVLGALGRDDEALRALEAGLANAEAQPGIEEGSQTVAGAANNLAVWHTRRGNYAEARTYFDRALENFEKILPKGHPNFGTLNANLAALNRRLGDPTRALKHAEEALAIDRGTLGEDHPGTANSFYQVGFVLQVLGRYEESIEASRQALAISDRSQGTGHTNSHAYQMALAHALLYSGRWEEARELLDDVSDRMEADDDQPERPVTALQSVGTAYRFLGDEASSRQALERALALAREDGNPELIATSHLALGLLDAQLGNAAAARASYDAAEQLEGCADGPCELDGYRSASRAALFAQIGDVAQAFRYLEQSLEWQGRTVWPLHSPDFDGIRADPRWSDWAARLEASLGIE